MFVDFDRTTPLYQLHVVLMHFLFHPQQFYCMKNIRNFLASCERDFGLTREALFDASELFDVSDFAKVSVSF